MGEGDTLVIKEILNVSFGLLIQLIDATQALNRSASILNSNVFLGRSLSCLATVLIFACECTDKSVPLVKYCPSKRLVYSFEPRR